MWSAVVREELQYRIELSNPHDLFAVAVCKSDGAVVGLIPRRIFFNSFLRRGGTITCKVTGPRRYSADFSTWETIDSTSLLAALISLARLDCFFFFLIFWAAKKKRLPYWQPRLVCVAGPLFLPHPNIKKKKKRSSHVRPSLDGRQWHNP